MADDVEVISAFGIRRFDGQLERGFGKQFVVTMGNAPAFTGPFLQMAQFDSEDGTLDTFHAIVEADFLMIVALAGAVFAQSSGARRHFGVVGDQRSAFAIGAEIFTGIKTEL